MEELKRYTSFEALKLSEKSGDAGQLKDTIFSAFEAFIKRLLREGSSEKIIKSTKKRIKSK